MCSGLIVFWVIARGKSCEVILATNPVEGEATANFGTRLCNMAHETGKSTRAPVGANMK